MVATLLSISLSDMLGASPQVFLIAQSADGPWRKAALDLGDVEYDNSLFCSSAAARRFAMRESHGGADRLRV